MLCSSKTVDEDTVPMARCLRQSVPGPRLGAAVELDGDDAGGAVNLVGVDEALAGDGPTAEQRPPGFSEPMLLHVL